MNYFGTSMADYINAQPGIINIYAGGGNDLIYGNGLDNWIYGHTGDDRAHGGGGNDVMYGHSGRDLLFGDDGDDRIWGGADGDWLIGGNGEDTIGGGDGNDWIIGGDGKDSLLGGNGSDTISSGEGWWETIDGGAGTDLVDYSSLSRAVSGSLDRGVMAKGTLGVDWLRNVENVTGTHFDDRISGDNNANFLKGNRGDDELHGDGGNDILHGNDGEDSIYGDDGKDAIQGGAGNDFMDGGRDRDILDGGAGYDVMVGGGGADFFRFTQADDRAGFNDGWGKVEDFNRAAGDKIDLSDFGEMDFIGGGLFQANGEAQIRTKRDFQDFNDVELQIDLDGDGRADGHIDVESTSFYAAIGESDFVF